MTLRLTARVLIDSPLPQLDRLFDYSIPQPLIETAVPGVRVKVPLRSAGRVADGYIVDVTAGGDYAGTLSELDSVVSPISVLTPEVWALARRAADRAAGTASDIVRLAVPTRQVRVEKAFVHATTVSPVAPHPIDFYGPGVLESAVASGRRLAIDAVPYLTEVATGVWVGTWAVTLAALAAVTLASGRSAILAVPDYRDQEQLVAALTAILAADRVVRLDARQSNSDRYRGFLRALGDTPLAIVGNRSVVYAPAKNLGLIAVWDDGDPLHSEPLSPYVHTRDAALIRQELQGGALLFMAHSRSTDVERLVEVGYLASVSPKPLVLPKVIPTAQQVADDSVAARARIPSTAWREAKLALQSGPVLVQVARPGYAPRLACIDCGFTSRCIRCEGPLHQNTARAVPSCSWCGALAVGWTCSNCTGERMRQIGNGAARTADELGRAFPGIKVIVADGERPILTVGAEPALVIATIGAEPIAAGGYRAVLLLDGERMLARESLRVAEDCVRWWSNAIALAARGAPTVLVGVGGALASTMATWRQSDYARSELSDRRRLRFPPAVRVATLTGAVEVVAAAVETTKAEPLDVLGPVDVDASTVRTIVRFDYAHGAEIAATLRAEVIQAATNRRKTIAIAGKRGAARPTLKVRFDDIEPFRDV